MWHLGQADNTGVLKRYIEKNHLPTVEKDYHRYLTYEGIEDRFTYILKDGVIKESVISKHGQEFNLRYVTGLEIVSVLNGDFSQYIGEPYNVRVESSSATFYKIDRARFLQDIDQHLELQHYVKDFYHTRLTSSMKKMQQMLTNGRRGAVCTQLLELVDLFGRRQKNGEILIDFSVTNEELAKFCGISAASSVSRILAQLKKDGILRTDRQGMFIQDLDALQENIIF